MGRLDGRVTRLEQASGKNAENTIVWVQEGESHEEAVERHIAETGEQGPFILSSDPLGLKGSREMTIEEWVAWTRRGGHFK